MSDPAKRHEVEVEQAPRRVMRRLWAQLSARRRRQFFLVLAMMLLGAVAEVVSIGALVPFLAVVADPGRIRRLPGVDAALNAMGITTSDSLLVCLTIAFAASSLAAGAMRVALSWVSNTYVFALGHDFGTALYKRVLYQPYLWHVERNSSEVLAGIQKVQTVTNGMLAPLMQAATAGLIGLCIAAALLVVSPVISAIAFSVFGLMYIGVSYLSRRTLSANSKVISHANSERVRAVQEGLGGIRDVLLDGSQMVFLKRFSRVDHEFREAQATSNLIGTAPRFMIEATGMVLIAVLALWLTRGQDGFGSALPVLGALALGAQRLLPLMQLVFNGWTRVATNVHALDDVLTVLETPVHGTWLHGTKTEVAFNDHIAFRHVSFGYTLGEPPVLDGVEFVIPKGSRVGIVGKTGSGKSTLVDLLMGLLEPSAGSIEIDGWRLDDTTRRAWQLHIAHVPQAIFLADATIAENIAFGVDPWNIDPERVRDAARQAELSDFIETLPHKYETSVGERGVRLSGGQRQRIGIARALYKRASVLVFDEATSALDNQTEAAVIESVERLDRSLTIFIIAHRLSTVERCNLILNVSAGRLEIQSGEQWLHPVEIRGN